MKKGLVSGLLALAAIGFLFATSVFGADIELAKKSTIEEILKRGELRVGFESGYVPFEMTN
ncbi:MAG: amino acid ABC transporter substrate-binding protein, partial [Desulfobacterales bacterium]